MNDTYLYKTFETGKFLTDFLIGYNLKGASALCAFSGFYSHRPKNGKRRVPYGYSPQELKLFVAFSAA